MDGPQPKATGACIVSHESDVVLVLASSGGFAVWYEPQELPICLKTVIASDASNPLPGSPWATKHLVAGLFWRRLVSNKNLGPAFLYNHPEVDRMWGM